MNKNARLFLSYVLPSMVGMLIVGSYSIVDTIFIGWSAGELGLASVAVTWPLVMMFGAVGDMLGNRVRQLLSPSREAAATCGWHGSASATCWSGRYCSAC